MSFVHTITFRLTLWYLAVFGVLLGLLFSGVYFGLSANLHQNLDNALRLRVAELRSDPRRVVFRNIVEGSFQEELGEVVLLYYYSSGEVAVFSARDVGTGYDQHLAERVATGESFFTTVRTSDGGAMRLYAVPISPSGPEGFGFQGGLARWRARLPGLPSTQRTWSAALVVGRSTADIDAALLRLEHTVAIAVPLGLLLAGVGGVFLARRALKPVEHIANTAREIEEGDLTQRIKVRTKDELGMLASTLNQMIARLERAFQRQRQFTADASHELRTPLAAIQAEATLALHKERTTTAYAASLGLISQEAEYMAGIIDELLTLARADAGKESMHLEEVDLGQLVAGVLTDARILCDEKGLELRTGDLQNVIVRGDKGRLRTLFLNLIDNAVRYTPPGGVVSVSLERDGDSAVLAISDTGVGISAEDLPLIFERFYRVDKARSREDGGSGLGLAICKHIAEAHGGTLRVSSRPGEGSTFSVRLPILE